jgi:transcriptional regulator with XRE-family HTH domain
MSTHIGPRLRTMRLAREMTLDVLASSAGLHKAYLSRVERGLKAPSIATVLRLADALDVPVAELFGERLPADAVRITRAQPGEATAPLGQAAGTLAAFIARPGPEFSDDGLAGHSGEELLYVLDGIIEIRFADRGVVLDKGDSVQFAGTLPHQLRRIGEPPAAALVVVSRERKARGSAPGPR